jgi:hypothetical protein
MLELDTQATSAAAPEEVWALRADVRTWPEWADFDAAEAESGDGLGEVRRFRRGRRPIRDYLTDVTLTPSDGGTHIRWHSTFEATIPGTGRLVRRSLQRFVADTAERLARAAERP